MNPVLPNPLTDNLVTVPSRPVLFLFLHCCICPGDGDEDDDDDEEATDHGNSDVEPESTDDDAMEH